jgi:RNA-directed DNA polymerase
VKTAWKYDWVIDLDIKGFFDNIPHDKLMLAVEKHVPENWVLHVYQKMALFTSADKIRRFN